VSGPEPAFRCATSARDRTDPTAGSAPQARRWLLLEHPGPWPIDAIAGSGLRASTLSLLRTSAEIGGARMLLVRRPGRRDPQAERRWTVIGPDFETVTAPWTDGRNLLRACLALTQPAELPATPQAPVILVCTHGVHDVCCAIRGRPVAAALAERWPDLVWECSHVGGDRFAPNVVLLPEGFYYGNLDPDSAVRIVSEYLAGTVSTEGLRGMASAPPPEQAAMIAAYERLGPLAPGAVMVRRSLQRGPHHSHGSETTVDLRIDGRPALVRVEVEAVRRPPAQLTCRAGRATPATEYQVRSFDSLPRT
jgi:hypothetical protein